MAFKSGPSKRGPPLRERLEGGGGGRASRLEKVGDGNRLGERDTKVIVARVCGRI